MKSLLAAINARTVVKQSKKYRQLRIIKSAIVISHIKEIRKEKLNFKWRYMN